MISFLVAVLALLAAGLAWLLSVTREELRAARAKAGLLGGVVEYEKARSTAEIERRAAERARELEHRAEAERVRWVEQERAQVAADAEARADHRCAVWQTETEAAIRRDAVAKSTAVVRGNVTEHLLPFMEQFPYDPRDCRFLGAPVDLVVFDGLYGDGLRDVVFLEVKTGGSRVTERERAVRDAVTAGRVRWEQVRV